MPVTSKACKLSGFFARTAFIWLSASDGLFRVKEGGGQKIVSGTQVGIQIDGLEEGRLRQIKLFFGKVKFASQVVPNSGVWLFLKNFIDSAMTGGIVFARNIEVDKLLEGRWIIRCQLRCFFKSFARFGDFVLLLQNDAEQKVGGQRSVAIS